MSSDSSTPLSVGRVRRSRNPTNSISAHEENVGFTLAGTRRCANPTYEAANDELRQLAGQMRALFHQATQAASGEVDDIIQRGVRDTHRIEHLLDHMLGFCCDPDMLALFKRLCRYYFAIDPVATAEHINAYREIWDTPDEADDDGGRV